MRLNLPLVPMESGGGYTAPGQKDFLFPDGMFGISWLNKPLALAIIGAIVVIAYWLIASRRLQVVPSKGQFAAEYLYDFVRNGVARDILGPKYKTYLPYLLGLFTFILVNNWFGELFLFMFPTFSKVGFAYALAAMTWFIYIGAGIKEHGLKYFKLQLIPEGVPFYLLPLIIPLEFLSNFITRPVTLALRLFANLFAGHLVVMVFVVGGAFLIQYDNNLFFNVAGGVSFIFSIAILLLELFIGALQAYIFTVLTAQYISTSVADSH